MEHAVNVEEEITDEKKYMLQMVNPVKIEVGIYGVQQGSQSASHGKPSQRGKQYDRVKGRGSKGGRGTWCVLDFILRLTKQSCKCTKKQL